MAFVTLRLHSEEQFLTLLSVYGGSMLCFQLALVNKLHAYSLQALFTSILVKVIVHVLFNPFILTITLSLWSWLSWAYSIYPNSLALFLKCGLWCVPQQIPLWCPSCGCHYAISLQWKLSFRVLSKESDTRHVFLQQPSFWFKSFHLRISGLHRIWSKMICY